MKTSDRLKSLYYFYTAAEHLSIKRAAQQLYVTQAAVSQQVRLLESHLQTPLFERHHRSLALTPAGEKLLPYLKVAFESLERGLADLKEDEDPMTLSLSVLPSFAAKWLIPRLGDFYKSYPGVTVNLTMTEQLETFGKSGIDLSIRFGGGTYPGLESRFLMSDYIYPACHPGYVDVATIAKLEDLRALRVLDDSVSDIGWPHWLAQKGLPDINFPHYIRFDGSHYVIDSALSGQGVAMVRHSLVAEAIHQGNLVRLLGEPVKLNYGYYLCGLPSSFSKAKVHRFAQWIAAEAAGFMNRFNLA